MVLFESVRRRFSHRLESHQIEEDYSPRQSRSHHRSTPTLTENIRYESGGYSTPLVDFDPSEDVPSYEASQLMYERLSSSIHANCEPHYSNDHSYNPSLNNDPIVTSISNSTNISRQSSVIAGSNTDLSNNSNGINANGNSAGSNSGTTRGGGPNRSIKHIGLKFLNARQHFALAFCRDLSLIPCLLGLFQSWKRVFYDEDIINSPSITSAKLPEHFLTGVWCMVAGYLSFSVLDGLMIRWIVTYLTSAAILRMLSMSTIIVTIEQYLLSTLTADGYKYVLHIWILISCCLTFVYIVQNFVTLNLDLKGKRRARFFDFYNIVVFAVVPVGLASFITMIGLLRSLLIVRIDVENSCLPRSYF